MSRVKFNDKQQADLAEMQALADSSEDNAFELTKLLLFAADYRVEGGLVVENSPASGITKIEPGIFVKADGKFYKLAAEATANILTGTEDQPANVWGTGQAADPTNPRKTIIVVSHQFVEDVTAVKNFIDDSVSPPVQYTQSVTTRKNSAPIFSVLHGTPAASPTEPAVPSGFLKLATIDVPAGATTILTANITNNLNINVLTLEKLQQASQAQSAFSDILHSDGVYQGYLSELETVETAPQSLAVSVGTGNALRDGVTARVATATTVPIDASSFFPINDEAVSFAGGDTQTLLTNGTPPHQIRSGTVIVTGVGGAPVYAEGPDYTVDYLNGTITRQGAGSIPGGGSVEVDYQYHLPRIDRIEILMSNSTPQAVTGTPAQTPVAPPASPNALTLATVAVGEGVTVITNGDITDLRVFLPDMDELIAARGAYANVDARFIADEAAIAQNASDLSDHEAENITGLNAVHGIQQGAGNGFDADTIDGDHASALKDRANHTGTQAPSTISPQGDTSTLDADQVDGFDASATPAANTLLALDGSGQFPSAAIPGLFDPGDSLTKNLVVQSDALSPATTFNLTASLLSVQGVVIAPVNLSVNITVSGANGLDTGTEAPSTWYAIHVITNNDGSSVGSLLSLSPTAPTLPGGFTKFRRVAWVRNNGSSNFVRYYSENGDTHYRNPQFDTSQYGTFGTVSLADYVPPGVRVVSVNSIAYRTGGSGGTSSHIRQTDETDINWAGNDNMIGGGDGSSVPGTLHFYLDANREMYNIHSSNNSLTFIWGYTDPGGR